MASRLPWRMIPRHQHGDLELQAGLLDLSGLGVPLLRNADLDLHGVQGDGLVGPYPEEIFDILTPRVDHHPALLVAGHGAGFALRAAGEAKGDGHLLAGDGHR
jgi:hypothetical protein